MFNANPLKIVNPTNIPEAHSYNKWTCLTANILLLLLYFQMREFLHDNLNPFIGAYFETEAPFTLFVYCPKGSLQVTILLQCLQTQLYSYTW